jgi:integrase
MTFAVGDRISAWWCDRPGCDDFNPTPVEWSGTVAAAWSPVQRNLHVRWDRRVCPRLVGAALAPFPPWDLPSSEAIFALPTLVSARPATTAAVTTGHAPPPLVAEPDPEPDDGDPDDEPEDLDDLVALWSAAPGTFPEDTLAPFRRGNGTSLPAVAALRGSDLITLLAQPTPPVPRLVTAGLVRSTRLEHLRTLRFLAALPPQLAPLPLPTAIITMIDRVKAERRWRSSTLLKRLATAQGALALLPAYRTAPPVQLAQCPLWRQAMRAAGIAARQELPKQPRPCSLQEVKTALSLEPCLPTAAAIIIAWSTAARTGCVLQLDRADVAVNGDRSLSVRFRRGKSARIRGPYTVHTAPLEETMFRRLERWLAGRRTKLFASMTTGENIRSALRRVHPALEQRSLRRGALQALARSPGITDEVLMLFSGHTQVATLRRYLSWGVAAAHTRDTMAQHRAE